MLVDSQILDTRELVQPRSPNLPMPRKTMIIFNNITNNLLDGNGTALY